MNLNDLVPNVRVDTCVRVFSLFDGKCNFERVARRNCDFVCKEVYVVVPAKFKLARKADEFAGSSAYR